MAHPKASKKRAKAISTSLFLVGLAILFFLDKWWPGIMIVIGIPLALRQFLLGRTHDMLISLFVFVGFFVIAQFNISWKILIPILFVLGALFILVREFLDSYQVAEEEEEEDINLEIEEEKKD